MSLMRNRVQIYVTINEVKLSKMIGIVLKMNRTIDKKRNGYWK